ncbi:hypothetical protein C3369_18585 [Escherichia sp. ESNIH1]|uniref:hypothetical protein n=1 Tax=Escherichia sp. ESNIH1 TaxID=1985876 RepID=UPI000CDDDC47|nr:hypothetical protein [Escherichia sp. ESNIH1]POT98465.1 hypothetical protein C3369_18585 [Escherichia sp. ESNIH1]
MRILLALITVFAVFQAQAYCYITGSTNQREVTSDPIELNLDTNSGTITKTVNLKSDTPDFKCFLGTSQTNTFSLSTANGSAQYYSITNGVHRLVLKVSLESQSPTQSSFYTGPIIGTTTYKAEQLNSQFSYKLTYSVQSIEHETSAKSQSINEPFPLDDYIIIRPYPCSNNICYLGFNNSAHQYINKVRVVAKFTPTTCAFGNQEVSAKDISYHEIDSNAFDTPKTIQPTLKCSTTTSMATSNIYYHFEPISNINNGILENDLATQPGSAGEVGFKLRNNGEDLIFQPSQKFTLANRGNAVSNSIDYPLNLQLRYARYGNKVFTGKVQSKVKVVVDYD